MFLQRTVPTQTLPNKCVQHGASQHNVFITPQIDVTQMLNEMSREVLAIAHFEIKLCLHVRWQTIR